LILGTLDAGMKEFQVKPEIQAFLFSKKPESGFFLGNNP